MGRLCQCCSRLLKKAYFWPKDFAAYVWKEKAWRCVLLIYLCTFLIFLPLICLNLRHSIYFLKNEQNKLQLEHYLQNQNNERVQKAYQYFAMLNQTKLHSALEKDDSQVDIFLAIITVSRNRHKVDDYEPRYLSQVVWKLMETLHVSITQGFKRKVKMAVCNVDMDPESYFEASYLRNHIQVINRFQNLTLSLDHPLEKEKADYTFCLNASLHYKPRYVLLLEDDALPHKDFFHVIHHILKQRVEYAHDHFSELVPNKKNVTFVKLYHPERLLGYLNFEPDRIPELIGIALLFGTVFYLIYKAIFPYKPKSELVLWLVLAVYAVAIAVAVGRAHLVELRRTFSPQLYTYMAAPECCTPAMLFPYEGGQQVISYLNARTAGNNYGKDMILEDMKKSEDICTYMVQPNLIQHIGLFSAIRKRAVDPFVV